jgi:quercetin dioxygenase-like cupin family protein
MARIVHTLIACCGLASIAFALPVLAQDKPHSPMAAPNPPVFKQVTTEFPKGDQLEARMMTALIQPGSASPWHTHAAPVAVYVIDGTFTLELKGREPVVLKAGQGMLEPINVEMRAANRSDEPVKVVIFQVSDPATPFMHPTTQ